MTTDMGDDQKAEGHPTSPMPVSPPKPKDLWDKISTLSVPFATLVIGILGAYMTASYNATALKQQAAQAEADRFQRTQQANDAKLLNQAQALEGLYSFVASTDPQKRLFGYEMYVALGQKELAAKLIGVNMDEAGIPVLKKLTQDPNTSVSTAATNSLASFENATEAGGNVLHSRRSCREFMEMNFRAQRQPATPDDYRRVAEKLGVEAEALSAFITTEAAANSTLPDGRPQILFERRVFRRLTQGAYDSHPDISSDEIGGYGPPGAHQYERLAEAASLNCPAALAATSWGAFQIIGSVSKEAGYEYVDDFVRDIMSSGSKELDAAATAMQSFRIVPALKAKDWLTVARRYNGPVKPEFWAGKLAAAYQVAVRASAHDTSHN